MGRVDRRVEAEAVGELRGRRIAQHQLAAADQDRDVVGADVEAVQQRLDVGVVLEVEVRVRMAVAREELLMRSVPEQ